MKTDALLSPCGLYRYSLTRERDVALPLPGAPGPGAIGRVLFVMLNPSTADALEDDATIRRCMGFAWSWGYLVLEVVNLFAWRATDPKDLRVALNAGHSIIGPQNDEHILQAARAANEIVCAWGQGGGLCGRDAFVVKMLGQIPTKCLGLTSLGRPKHPLYLSNDTPRRRFSP